jgi:uncharacterized coiled-coil protein SlyX
MEAVQKEMTEAINKATADHELRMRQLQDRVDAMERTVNEVVAKNKEEEQRMRKVTNYALDLLFQLRSSYSSQKTITFVLLMCVYSCVRSHDDVTCSLTCSMFSFVAV